MLTGKKLILATREFAKEDRLKSWYFTISTLLILVLSLIGTVYNFHLIGKIVCSIFSGLVIVRMFVIYHDYLHDTILQRSILAKFIFSLFGLYVLAPKTVWKRTHDYHHKHNSKFFKLSIGSYPVYTTKKFENCTSSEKNKYLFVRHPLTILFGYLFTFTYGMCINPIINGFKKHFDSLVALILHFTGQFCILFFLGWEQLLFLSIIPHFISGALGAYLFYVQHNFPGVYFADDEEWTYEASALESSSYLELCPFLNWVTANIGYHHIHHINARIPFYELPGIMKKFKELQNPKKTSLKPKAIIACLKLKLWDIEKKRMVAIMK